MVWIAFLLLALTMTGGQKAYGADPWTDASCFYQTYGNAVVFHPTGGGDGEICYATHAPTSADMTRYRTIGWQLTLLDPEGETLQILYFACNGSWLKQVSVRNTDGYTDILYRMNLSDLRSRLQEETSAALRQGNCRMVLDACMVVSENGKETGSMTDDGLFSGNVYRTAAGIQNAAPWGPASYAALRSYYGKEIQGLFCSVTLQGEDGIQTLEGAGSYCYGTQVRISAETAEGYEFSGWTGSLEREEMSFTLILTGDLDLMAHAAADQPPVICCCDRYYSLKAARAGRITEGELLSHVSASDPETGKLPLYTTRGAEETDTGILEEIREGTAGGMYIQNYDPAEFTQAAGETDILLTLLASDGSGHITEQEMKILIRDNATVSGRQLTGRIRFISGKYFETEAGVPVKAEEGGLIPGSVWLEDPSYYRLLQSVLDGSSAAWD